MKAAILRAVIYARVSSDKQRRDGTIENQLPALRAFVKAQGWELVAEYVDDGLSAKTGTLDDRVQFLRCQAFARQRPRPFDVLVVWDSDRLTRTESISERSDVLAVFQDMGIGIASPTTGIRDLNTPMGQLYMTFDLVRAAEENRVKGERTKAGVERIARQGGKPKGCTPFGLTYDRATKAWGIDPIKGPLVVEALRRILGGESCVVVARSFGDRGAPAPRSHWNPGVLWRIVTSTHVIGSWLADRTKRITVTVPRLVDDATFFAVQDKLAIHKQRGLTRTRHVYALETPRGEPAMAVCGVCGAPIFIVSPVPRIHRPAKYRCGSALRGRPGARCTAEAVSVADLDARVWDLVARKLASPRLADLIRRHGAAQRAERHDWGKDLAGYRTKLATLDKREAAILGMFQAGEIASESAVKLQLQANARTRAMLKGQITTAQQALAQADNAEPGDDPERWLGMLRQLATKANATEQQLLVRKLMKPGAILSGNQLEFLLRFEPPTPTLVLRSACRTQHQTAVEIRLVA